MIKALAITEPDIKETSLSGLSPPARTNIFILSPLTNYIMNNLLLKYQFVLYNMQIVLYDMCMENVDYIFDGEYGKRGYLTENFKVFNIKDKRKEEFEFHYHEFNKIIFFISGDVKYNIEGKEYQLDPYDVLLVKSGDIHRPVINESITYERIVIWIDNNFLDSTGFSKCFDVADKKGISIIRTDNNDLFGLADTLSSSNKNDYEAERFNDAVLAQLLILITRKIINDEITAAKFKSDNQIDKIIHYINSNLDKRLTICDISNKFYISRYYLMHKFKAYTGKTLYSYIQSKKLLKALNNIKKGMTAKQACYESGFNDYSVFLKAFKNEFGVAPSKIK